MYNVTTVNDDSAPLFGKNNSRALSILRVSLILSILSLFASITILIVSLYDKNDHPTPSTIPTNAMTTSIPSTLGTTPSNVGKIVSIKNNKLKVGAGVTLFINSTFDVREEVKHTDLIALGQTNLMIFSDDGILLGSVNDMSVVWNTHDLPTNAYVSDALISLSETDFFLISGGRVMAGRLVPGGGGGGSKLIFGPWMTYYDGVTIKPVTTALSTSRVAISYFCQPTTTLGICTAVMEIQSNLSVSLVSFKWYSRDHTFHDIIALNETQYLLFYPMDNFTGQVYSGPLTMVVATVQPTGDISLGPEIQVLTPNSLEDFFGAALLSDNRVVVTFPDGLLLGGLRSIAVQVISPTEIKEIASFLPNPGDQDTEYRFMSTGSLGNDRFFIAYSNTITNRPLTVLIGALIGPSSVLRRISPVFNLGSTIPQGASNVIWISGVAINESRFAVAYSFTGGPHVPAGGRVIMGDLSNGLLGYITSATDTSVTLTTSGVITISSSMLTLGCVYYTNAWGDLIEGPQFDDLFSLPSMKEEMFFVTGDGQIVTEAIGVVISSNQLLLFSRS